VLPPNVPVASTTFGVSTINLLENSAQSWYDAGYVNVRRRAAKGLSLLANYTWSKSLSNAPDFRSPMFEASIPQNNNDLAAEKGPACDVRSRFVLSAIYDVPGWARNGFTRSITSNWRTSAIVQLQTGFPLTISVFGDTANAGTALGENPVRANVTGKPVFGPGTRNAVRWFNPAAFLAPPNNSGFYGNLGRDTLRGPGLATLDLSFLKDTRVSEKVKLQFRADLFNILNRANFNSPNAIVFTPAGVSPTAGLITSTSTTSRQVQFALKLNF